MTEEFAAEGFVIERLVEPRPLGAMQATHPHAYERLMNLPAFVLFVLRPT